MHGMKEGNRCERPHPARSAGRHALTLIAQRPRLSSDATAQAAAKAYVQFFAHLELTFAELRVVER